MLLDYKSLHDGLNQAEINALYSILRKETIFTETLLIGTTGKYGVYNIVDTGIHVTNAVPTGQYTFNFSDGTVGVGVANDEGIVDVDISFDRSSVCDVVITFPPYVVRINYSLSLTADKSIIQKDESVVVTALLTMDGSARSGESLSYSVKHGSSVIDSGTLTTDSSGQTTISYVGTGVGDVSIEVSYGTLLQETYEVWDTLMYDIATTGKKSTDWHIQTGTLTLTTDDYGTLLDNTGTGKGAYVCNLPNTTPSAFDEEWEAPFAVEFDIVDSSDLSKCYMQVAPLDSTAYSPALNVNGSVIGSHHRIECRSTGYTIYIDDRTPIVLDRPINGLASIRFQIGQGASLKYKNFVIYTIGTYNLTLSSDKDILSAQDGESATITALLTEDNVPIEDIELEYSIKHDNTVIDSGTITTNSNGEANIVYTATGVGDVSVEVSYGTLLQETYELEDTIAFSDCTNNSIENIFDVPSNVKNSTYEFSATGWKYGNVSQYTNMLLQSSISLSKPTSLSLKLIENSGEGLSFNIGKSGNDWIYLSIQYGELIYNGNRLKAPVMGAEYTVKVFSDKIEIYENNTLLYTDNITLTEWYVALGTGTNRYVRIKDFKIKAL